MKKILVIIILIFTYGCSEETTAPIESELVGKWKTNFTRVDEKGKSYVALLVLEFKSNGNFSLESQQSSEFTINESGTYSISGDVLTIMNKICTNMKGGYKIEFRDNGLKLTEIEDLCGHNSLLKLFYYDFDEVFAE